MATIQTVQLARQLALQGDYASALKHANVALKAGFNTLDLYIDMGRWHHERGEYDQLINLLEPLAKQHDNHIVLPQLLATAYHYKMDRARCIHFTDHSSRLANLKFQSHWHTFTTLFAKMVSASYTLEKLAEVFLNFSALKNSFYKATSWQTYAFGYPYNKHAMYLFGDNYLKGYQLYERRPINPQLYPLLNRYPYWQGESLHNKTLLILAEQGIGDELLLCSCLKDATQKAERCIYIGEPRLQRLWEYTFPDIQFIPCIQAELKNLSYITADYIILLGSLLKFFRQTTSDFPSNFTLKLDESKRFYFRNLLRQLSPYPKIGLSWRSLKKRGEKFSMLSIEYLALKELKPILELKEITFINLQYEYSPEEITKCEKKFNCKIHILPDIDLFNDIFSTAHLMAELDMIISPNTTTQSLSNLVNPHTCLLQACIPISPSPMQMKPEIQSVMLPNTLIYMKKDNYNWKPTIQDLRRHIIKKFGLPS